MKNLLEKITGLKNNSATSQTQVICLDEHCATDIDANKRTMYGVFGGTLKKVGCC